MWFFLLRTKLGMAVLGGAGILIVVGAVYTAGQIKGRQAIKDRIDEQNQQAKDASDETATDFMSCIDAGGLWDFSASKCNP